MDSIRKDSPIPIYKQLADVIRDQILSGELKPGAQLPGELELAKTYQISRSSVRRTIDLLSNAGMVTSIHGKGTFIRDWTETNGPGGVIALLVPDSRVFLFMNVLNGVVNAAKSRGYTTVFSFLGKNESEQDKNFDQLRQHGVEGFVIFPRNNITYDAAIWRLFKENFPFVLIDRYFPELPSNFVGIDNTQAAYEVVSHLAGLGYRSIGFAATTGMETITVSERFEGYQKALITHGIDYDSRWRFETLLDSSSPVIPEEDEEGQVEIFRNLFQERGHPQAIFSINDITAYLVGKAAKAEGITIPTDLALAGMDDDEYARRAEVPLTTVRQPFEDIGARGAHLLIDIIRGGSGKIERVLLPTQLVIRRSCGAALFHPQSVNVGNES